MQTQQRARHAASSTTAKINTSRHTKKNAGLSPRYRLRRKMLLGDICGPQWPRPSHYRTKRKTDKTEITQGGASHVPRADISQMANRAASHRSWAVGWVDIKHGKTEARTKKNRLKQGTSPHGAQSATQSDMGADLGESSGHMLMKWRHLIRKPAKLTGTRRELCTWGEPTRTWCG
jgi:hypothetical protein